MSAPHQALPGPDLPAVEHIDPRAAALLVADGELRTVVTEAVARLRSAFPGAHIDVTYFADSEDAHGREHVVVTVFPKSTRAEAREKRRALNDAWVFEERERVGGRLLVEVHPVP
jgi:hypothetical protein